MLDHAGDSTSATCNLIGPSAASTSRPELPRIGDATVMGVRLSYQPGGRVPSFGARVRASAVLIAVLATLLSSRVSAAPAAAVLLDVSAAPELSEQAGAISLLLRSHLKAGPRPLTPSHELALAIEAVTGHVPGASLVVGEDLGTKLMERLAADRVVVLNLQAVPKGLAVLGVVLGPGGKRVARVSALAARAEIAELAHRAAQKIAPALEANSSDRLDAGLIELRPFLLARSGILTGDAVGAARALEVALPSVAARIPAARELIQSVSDDPGLPAPARVQARLLLGDWSAAIELADQGLSGDPKHIVLRAAKARALASLRDFVGADRELDLLKDSRLAQVLVARLVLAVERGDSPDARDQAVAPLVGRPASEWRAVLPIIATLPPNALGPATEAAALAAAQRLSKQEPGLSSIVAARALAGGALPAQTASLIRVQDLGSDDVKHLSARLEKVGDDPAVSTLRSEIKTRIDESEQATAAQGPPRPTGPPSTLAKNLRPLIERFDLFYEPSLTTVTLAPLPGSGQPFYWPFLVQRDRLADGLLEALGRQPWDLTANRTQVATEELAPNRSSEEALAALAPDLGSQAVLMYRIRPAGLAPWVSVELVLFDVAHQTVQHSSGALIGRATGLVMINPIVAGIIGLALLCSLGWVTIIAFRGAIGVRVEWDPDSKDEMFSILISRSSRTPTIESPTLYAKKLEWLGHRKRRYEAWNIERSTLFRGIPRGKYYVHLYGTYTRGRQTLVLNEPAQTIEVAARKTAFVMFHLEASEAEFKLTVVDNNGPVEGARVWLDKDTARSTASGKNGEATLRVPKGYHVIHVAARGLEVERPYHVIKSKVHEMTINLVWERRQEYVSRALERQVDDADVYMTAHKTGAASAPSAPVAPAGLDAPPPVTSRASNPVPVAAAAPSAARGTSAPLPRRPSSPTDAPELPSPVDLGPPLDLDVPVDLGPGPRRR
jgi:hypothetical protein